ncbi:MAG TPA: SEC-C metal-binding domain-containing protein [Polyangiaceae bacterium]
MTEGFSPLLDELYATEKTLPASLRDRIVAEGSPIIPALIDVLLDDDDVEDGDVEDGGGWASIHAVDLLSDLKAEAAIQPMLRVLAETDWDVIVHDRIVLRLPEFGAPVLEPALALLSHDPPAHVAESRCAILSQLGVRDERVFEQLVSCFAESPDMASNWLANYGDERGLPLVEREIWEFDLDEESPVALIMLRDLEESYERLGGPLPDDLRAHVGELTARWNAPLVPLPPVATVASAIRIGRNDPCPCGSGKKYKRCHLGTTGDA